MPVDLLCLPRGKRFNIPSATPEQVRGRQIRCPVCKGVHDAVAPPRFRVRCQDCGAETLPDLEICAVCGLRYRDLSRTGFGSDDVRCGSRFGRLAFCPRGIWFVCEDVIVELESRAGGVLRGSLTGMALAGMESSRVGRKYGVGSGERYHQRDGFDVNRVAPESAYERMGAFCLDEQVRSFGGSFRIGADQLLGLALKKGQLLVLALKANRKKTYRFRCWEQGGRLGELAATEWDLLLG